jgi:hypothetical protein
VEEIDDDDDDDEGLQREIVFEQALTSMSSAPFPELTGHHGAQGQHQHQHQQALISSDTSPFDHSLLTTSNKLVGGPSPLIVSALPSSSVFLTSTVKGQQVREPLPQQQPTILLLVSSQGSPASQQHQQHHQGAPLPPPSQLPSGGGGGGGSPSPNALTPSHHYHHPGGGGGGGASGTSSRHASISSSSSAAFNPLIYGNDVDSVDVATRIAMVGRKLLISPIDMKCLFVDECLSYSKVSFFR